MKFFQIHHHIPGTCQHDNPLRYKIKHDVKIKQRFLEPSCHSIPCLAMNSAHPIILLFLILSLINLSMSITEDEALLKFKWSLTQNNALDSWVASTPPCNGWVGVVCFQGIVTGLHLQDMALSGKVDVDSLTTLHGLRTLSLANNSFSGPIPEFNRLGKLKSLLLSKNKFSGQIPGNFFESMDSLKKIWLSSNNFSGNIPISILQLDNLLELHLEGNRFSGPIPPIQSKKLGSLDFSHNKLQGEIPATLEKYNASIFDDNPGLCGKPLNISCSDLMKPVAAAVPETPQPTSGGGLKTIVWTIVVFLIAVVLIFAILAPRRKRRRDNDFSVLGKEKLQDSVGVDVRSSRKYRIGSAKRVGSSKKSTHGSKHGLGDLVIVDDEKGVFGLTDLMKASAEVLGNSGLGSAYKASMTNGLSVVVKRIWEMNAMGKTEFDSTMRRFAKLRHPNILTPLAYHYRKEEKLLVSEYIPNGSLLNVLHADQGIRHAELNWPTRLRIIQGVARGLGFLHSQLSSYDLPHGNLKSSNILLSENYEPLLSDYGFHPLISSPQTARAMQAYKAPETEQNHYISPKCDVYCLGIVILEILTGKFPSQYAASTRVGVDVVQLCLSAIPEEEALDPDIVNSVDSKDQMLQLLHVGVACVERQPDNRPDIQEAIRYIEEIQV